VKLRCDDTDERHQTLTIEVADVRLHQFVYFYVKISHFGRVYVKLINTLRPKRLHFRLVRIII